MTSTSLTSPQDQPTHRLTLKLEDGTFRTFFLTPKEAEWMARNINSNDPFIQLPAAVDPAAPSFYPKRGAWMERMSAEEIAARKKRYSVPAETKEDYTKKKRNQEVIAWSKNNPVEYGRMVLAARERLRKGGGFFLLASRNSQEFLIKYEAMHAAEEHLFPSSSHD